MRRIVYSLLQYRHSLLRSDTFNIGIVFYFPDKADKMLFYCSPNIKALKSLYPDMDYQMLITYLSYINDNVQRGRIKHYMGTSVDVELKIFLKKYVLLEDATVLRFDEPVIISNIEHGKSIDMLKNYTKVLLSFRDGNECRWCCTANNSLGLCPLSVYIGCGDVRLCAGDGESV